MVSIFVYHTVIFQEQEKTVTWSAPSPTCSPLIFDPNLRIQVRKLSIEIDIRNLRVSLVRFGDTSPTVWSTRGTSTSWSTCCSCCWWDSPWR